MTFLRRPEDVLKMSVSVGFRIGMRQNSIILEILLFFDDSKRLINPSKLPNIRCKFLLKLKEVRFVFSTFKLTSVHIFKLIL